MSAPQPHPRRSIPPGMAFTVWSAGDGWPLRSFAWPQADAARGSLLFLTGRGDFIEKYLEPLAHWHGTAGISPASTGAGRADRGACWPIR